MREAFDTSGQLSILHWQRLAKRLPGAAAVYQQETDMFVVAELTLKEWRILPGVSFGSMVRGDSRSDR